MIYLDNAATTRVCPEAARAALAAMTEDFGNPSSRYAHGAAAAEALRAHRAAVAEAVGANRDSIVSSAAHLRFCARPRARQLPGRLTMGYAQASSHP